MLSLRRFPLIDVSTTLYAIVTVILLLVLMELLLREQTLSLWR
jgi:hypothetical protein